MYVHCRILYGIGHICTGQRVGLVWMYRNGNFFNKWVPCRFRVVIYPSFFIKTQFRTNFATAKNVRNSYFYTNHSFLEIPDCRIMPFSGRGFNVKNKNARFQKAHCIFGCPIIDSARHQAEIRTFLSALMLPKKKISFDGIFFSLARDCHIRSYSGSASWLRTAELLTFLADSK